MKTILTTLFLLLPATAFANMQCGIPPIPPLGCSGTQPVCICDGAGNCEYIYIGC